MAVMDFTTILQIELNHRCRPMPLMNSFGRVIPALLDEVLVELFHIKSGEKVLDVGGGAHPFQRADVVTEPYLNYPAHRSGIKVAANVQYRECFAEDLPFNDKEFDFVVARQVLEHVNDPAAACRELIRVGKRGFVETPQRNYELLLGPNPSHQWLVSLSNDALYFERRQFIRHPFRHLGLSIVPSSPEGQFLLHYEFKNLTNVQLYWEDNFEFQVMEHQPGFDYQNPDHAAEAHLDSALCSLFFPGSPLAHRESDAREALRYRPEWALAHNTLGVVLWRQGRYEEARAAFWKAAELESDCAAYQINSKLTPDAQPLIVNFSDTLPLDRQFFEEYLQPAGVNMDKLLSFPT
jgi:SAM-dependent methyltransferase